jgi:hypothetical protein
MFPSGWLHPLTFALNRKPTSGLGLISHISRCFAYVSSFDIGISLTFYFASSEFDLKSDGEPIANTLTGLGMNQQLRISHAFSCEIVPLKQSYIERNFRPHLLFRDITELGGEKAYVITHLTLTSDMLTDCLQADRLWVIEIDSR